MRLFFFAFALLFSCVANSSTIDMSDPNKVLHGIADNGLTRIVNEKQRLINEPGYIKEVIEQELLPYCDYKYAAYMVMGRALGRSLKKKTTQEQRDKFVEAFKIYLVNSYGHFLVEYDGQKFEIQDNPHYQDKKIVAINIQMFDENGQVTKVAMKLRKNPKTNSWKIYDVIAEGISMLKTKQKVIGDLIKKEGIDSVIGQLLDKNRELES